MLFFQKADWLVWFEILNLIGCFEGGDFSINHTLQSAINAEIALLRANQIAGNTTDFKMNIINW